MRIQKSVDTGLLILRVLLGSGIAYHGYNKIFGGQMGMLTGGVAKLGFPFPEAFAWAAALSEFAGGILIALGLFTQPAAFFLLVTMLVAIFGAHKNDPLQVRELAIAYGTGALALMFTGAGRFSADSVVLKNK
jgi:putative oxidoreductase